MAVGIYGSIWPLDRRGTWYPRVDLRPLDTIVIIQKEKYQGLTRTMQVSGLFSWWHCEKSLIFALLFDFSPEKTPPNGHFFPPSQRDNNYLSAPKIRSSIYKTELNLWIFFWFSFLVTKQGWQMHVFDLWPQVTTVPDMSEEKEKLLSLSFRFLYPMT